MKVCVCAALSSPFLYFPTFSSHLLCSRPRGHTVAIRAHHIIRWTVTASYPTGKHDASNGDKQIIGFPRNSSNGIAPPRNCLPFTRHERTRVRTYMHNQPLHLLTFKCTIFPRSSCDSGDRIGGLPAVSSLLLAFALDQSLMWSDQALMTRIPSSAPRHVESQGSMGNQCVSRCMCVLGFMSV